MSRYFISQGIAYPPIEVEIDGVPPCLFCGDPVTRPSMDGPLVCGSCDCGRNRDGSQWTEAQAEERYAHRRAKVAEYRACMIDLRVREAKELLTKMSKLLWSARGTYIETTACLADVCDSDDAAFMALARKLLPDLIHRDELRGAEVAKRAPEREGTRMTKLEFDPATLKIINDFDAHAKKRFLELLGHRDSPLQATAEISFCLGYKAGVIDLGDVQREQAVVDVAWMAAVLAAAIAWRDSPRVDASSLAGSVNVYEARLIAAVDAARAARKEGSS